MNRCLKSAWLSCWLVAIGLVVSAHGVSAELPKQRPLVYYHSVTDGRGATVSTAHAELP